MFFLFKKFIFLLLNPTRRFAFLKNRIGISPMDDSLYFSHVSAFLVLYRPTVLTISKKWVKEFIQPLENDYFKISGIKEWLFLFRKIRVKHRIERGVLLTYLYPQNYFHWWIDILARLASVRDLLALN